MTCVTCIVYLQARRIRAQTAHVKRTRVQQEMQTQVDALDTFEQTLLAKQRGVGFGPRRESRAIADSAA
jgi:hypothetical protein